MNYVRTSCLAGVLLACSAFAQAPDGTRPGSAAAPAAADAAAARPRVVYSDAGRAALAAAKEVVARTRGLRGPERTAALEAAAKAYDQVGADFAAEPSVAATAAFLAAELWRAQGSLALAEKDFLLAARLDPGRYAQRGLLGAADMQRRQERSDEALATYRKAAAVDPGSARAQDARLWQARLLQGAGRLDEAIVLFQAALESADPGAQAVEACNFLALAWIEKGDLDAAGHVIEHAEQAVASLGDEDPVVLERLKKSLEAMSARRALQRARDQRHEAGKDAAAFEAARERQGR